MRARVSRGLADFPELYSECFDFSPPQGWFGIVTELSEKLAKDPAIRVAQVKSKFGGLRFYIDGGDERADKLVREAESKAWVTCMQCGAPDAKCRGWRTLCDQCDREAA